MVSQMLFEGWESLSHPYKSLSPRLPRQSPRTMRAALGNAIGRYTPRTNDNDGQPMGWKSSVTNLAKRAYEGGVERVSTAVRAGAESDTWRQWCDRRKEETKGTEKIALFPGFAVKRWGGHSSQSSPS